VRLGGAGLWPGAEVPSGLAADEVVRAVQDEVFPFEKNLFRTESVLSASLQRLDGLWKDIALNLAPSPDGALRGREAAAMAATARWMYASALARTESRGMHKRQDFPDRDSRFHYRLISSGLDQIRVRPEAVARAEEALAS
jgi:succinate dehydrogenase/fumarate reductase flavoprotein subunit